MQYATIEIINSTEILYPMRTQFNDSGRNITVPAGTLYYHKRKKIIIFNEPSALIFNQPSKLKFVSWLSKFGMR